MFLPEEVAEGARAETRGERLGVSLEQRGLGHREREEGSGKWEEWRINSPRHA
jgi:hypothetical protein